MADWKQRILEAKELFELGAITEAEFQDVKSEALAFMRGASRPSNKMPAGETSWMSGSTNRLSGATIVETSDSHPLSGETIVGRVSTVSDEKIGDYHIISELGAGGMGRVLRGRHSIVGLAEREGDVAIKLMHASLSSDETFKNRFIQEASLGKSINHPNIAKVHHVYSDPLALVLSYIDGEELKALIPSGGLSLEKTIQFVRPIAEALDHLHANGIIHRDIKPANIKVSLSGVPMLLDFGIAKDTSSVSKMTTTSMAMGTEAYMAPEQMNAKHVGPEADQYALAMTVYECLCGSLPWADDETSAQVVMRKMMVDFVSLSELRDDLPAHVEKTLLRGLSVKVEARFESCVDFVDALGSGVSASSEGLSVYRIAVSKVVSDGVIEDWEREQLEVLQAELDISDAEAESIWSSFLPSQEEPIAILLDEASFFDGFSVGSESVVRFRLQNRGRLRYERVVCHAQYLQGGAYHSGKVLSIDPNRSEDYEIPIARGIIGKVDDLVKYVEAYSLLTGKEYVLTFTTGKEIGTIDIRYQSITMCVSSQILDTDGKFVTDDEIEIEEFLRQFNKIFGFSTEIHELIPYDGYIVQILISVEDWFGRCRYYRSVSIPQALLSEGFKTYWSESFLEQVEGFWLSGVYSLSESEYQVLIENKASINDDYISAVRSYDESQSLIYEELKVEERRQEEERRRAEERRKVEDIKRKEALRKSKEATRGIHSLVLSGGRFQMGALPSDGYAWSQEKPCHSVMISSDMVVMKYLVTQKVYESVMGNNPSHFKGGDRPVEKVSWYDAVKFANALSREFGLDEAYFINGEDVVCDWSSNGWRLPTEAEWEYLARGGEAHLYAGSNSIGDVAWYGHIYWDSKEMTWKEGSEGNSSRQTHPVGRKKPNRFNLYDMTGNVSEWCWDIWGNYSIGSEIDPRGPSSGSFRVFRGGSCFYDASLNRVSFRNYYEPSVCNGDLGFRLLRRQWSISEIY